MGQSREVPGMWMTDGRGLRVRDPRMRRPSKWRDRELVRKVNLASWMAPQSWKARWQ